MLPNGDQMRQRLLDLFPKASLDSFAAAIGERTKETMIAAILDTASDDQLTDFVCTKFGRLHQHIYIYQHNRHASRTLPTATPFGVSPLTAPRDVGGEQHYTYISQLDYDLLLADPAGIVRETVSFPWPIKIVSAPDHLRIHFAIMAKDLKVYVDDGRIIEKTTRQRTKSQLLLQLPIDLEVGGMIPVDINGGIKALWDEDVFDGARVRFKRPNATLTEAMDSSFTIKQSDPELFAEILISPILHIAAHFTSNAFTASFVAQPTKGNLSFRRYSVPSTAVDEFIRQILSANR